MCLLRVFLSLSFLFCCCLTGEIQRRIICPGETKQQTIKCPPSYTIQIQWAFYGRLRPTECGTTVKPSTCKGSTTTAYEFAVAACNGKNQCTLNKPATDKKNLDLLKIKKLCPGSDKYFTVFWYCRAEGKQREQEFHYGVCKDDKSAEIGCPLDKKIQIINSLYGRGQNGDKWSCGAVTLVPKLCKMVEQIEYAKTICGGKNHCVLRPPTCAKGKKDAKCRCEASKPHIEVKFSCK